MWRIKSIFQYLCIWCEKFICILAFSSQTDLWFRFLSLPPPRNQMKTYCNSKFYILNMDIIIVDSWSWNENWMDFYWDAPMFWHLIWVYFVVSMLLITNDSVAFHRRRRRLLQFGHVKKKTCPRHRIIEICQTNLIVIEIFRSRISVFTNTRNTRIKLFPGPSTNHNM